MSRIGFPSSRTAVTGFGPTFHRPMLATRGRGLEGAVARKLDESGVPPEALGDDVQARDRDAGLDAVDREPRLLEAFQVEVGQAREERVVDLDRGARLAAVAVEAVDDPAGRVADGDGGLAGAVVQARDAVRKLAVCELAVRRLAEKEGAAAGVADDAVADAVLDERRARAVPLWSSSASTMPRPPGSTTSTSAISDQ